MAHSHSFKFSLKNAPRNYQVNCTSSGTILESLESSEKFKEIVKNCTFVIERQYSSTDCAIAKHFPCELIREGEMLTIHTIMDKTCEGANVKDEKPQDDGDRQKTIGVSGELVVFAINSKGGRNAKSKQILRNNYLKNVTTLCVYAYSNETIKSALERDGRFADIVFQDKCMLCDTNDKTELEINQNVNSLHGHNYEICLPRVKESHNNRPDYGEIMTILRCQFELQLIKKDFVKNTQSFLDMCQLEKLVHLGTSVGRIKVGDEHGTGFLLFDDFILTNEHVIAKSYDSNANKLTNPATINFDLGNKRTLDEELPLLSTVFACWKGRDNHRRYVDFALLKLQEHSEDISKLPRLLHEFTSRQNIQGICIIGHPGAGKKMMDVSCIVPHRETGPAAGNSIYVSVKFQADYSVFEVVGEGTFIATYNTCFLEGSSGSPVFDEDCKLIAMHTGGFFTDMNKDHIIEFGIPLYSIIWNIISQCLWTDEFF
uniref:Serine protease n=1 Tax=Pygocentrus nattereri TaxID=42514 RepID=A0AAR2K077_PYGNA